MKKNNFQFSAKVIDIETRVAWIVLIHQKDCQSLGIRPGDGLVIHLKGQSIGCYVDVTDTLVKRGEIGIFEDLAERFSIETGEILEISLLGKPKSLEAIQKKLSGKELSYKEVYEIVSDIVSRKLNDVAVAFFVASSFFEKISSRELFYLTKAMAETGDKLTFSGIVADKHSVGGLAGNETTPIIVPIVASYGIFIPKTCSRAITSASGTADTFETIAPVSFDVQKLKSIVNKTKGCIVWGTGNIVPSDARIIEVASQLMIESFSKMVSSIMAKKVALGIQNLVVDIPVNPFAKVKNMKEADQLKGIFEDIAKRFKIKIKVSVNKAREPIGKGIGPALQIRDDLKVLEQQKDRPLDLEKRALELAGYILELSGKVKTGKGFEIAKDSLCSGRALRKFQEIVSTQGGEKKISSQDIRLSGEKIDIKSPKSGRIKLIHNKNLIEICRILGAPYIKEAGIYLHKKTGEKVKRGEVLFTLYAGSPLRLDLALKVLKKKNPYLIQ